MILWLQIIKFFPSASWFIGPIDLGRLQRAVTPVGGIPLRVHAAVEAFGGGVGGGRGLVKVHGVDEPLGGRGGGGGFVEANGFLVDVSLEVGGRRSRSQAQISLRQRYH